MKRTVALGALWTVSAAAAVGLGFLAVSFVDADAAPGTGPATATAVPSSESAPSEPAPSDQGGPAAPTAEPPAAPSGEYATVGGTVYASCDGGVLEVAAAPAAGWWLDDQDATGEVEFESPTQKVEVHVSCAGGGPAFSDEGVRADDDEREDSSRSVSPTASSPSAGEPTDDSGRGRGGED
jgi:hypothetical protein